MTKEKAPRKTDNNYYVYVHRKKSDNSIFYIGKGKGWRAYDFKARSEYWKKTANKYGVTVGFIATNLQDWYALELECELILKYGRKNNKSGRLVNLTDGGDGASGIVKSLEERARISARQLGSLNHTFDTTVYEYKNIFTDEIINYTQSDFEAQTGYQHASTKLKHAGGWYRSGGLSEERVAEIKRGFKGDYSKQLDHTEHTFVNLKTGLEEVMSISGFVKRTGESPAKLLKEDSVTMRTKDYSTPYKVQLHGLFNLQNHAKDLKKYSVTHIYSGEVFEGTLKEIEYNLDIDIKTMRCVDGISKLWKLTSSTKDIPEEYTRYSFIHESGDEFFGTRSDFKRKYKTCLNNLFKKVITKPRKIKGWMFK